MPKVTIDFGQGATLERTLCGNTVMYVCTSSGHVVEALPGVYATTDFLSEVNSALKLTTTVPGQTDWPTLAAFYESRIANMVLAERRRITLSKAVVESPLLQALGVSAASTTERPLTPSEGHDRSEGIKDFKAAFDTVSHTIEDISHVPGRPGRGPKDVEAVIGLDSQSNMRLILPATHLLLRGYGHPVTPQECRDDIYERILHVAINDPYLGLRVTIPGTK